MLVGAGVVSLTHPQLNRLRASWRGKREGVREGGRDKVRYVGGRIGRCLEGCLEGEEGGIREGEGREIFKNVCWTIVRIQDDMLGCIKGGREGIVKEGKCTRG